MSEHQIVVVFDVSAPTRTAAAEAIAFALSRDGLCDQLRDTVELNDVKGTTALESWWFPEAEFKHLDGNDNSAMHLEHDDEPDDVGHQRVRPAPHPADCACAWHREPAL